MKSLRSETLLPCWPLLCSALLSNLARKLEWGAGQGSSASPVSFLPPILGSFGPRQGGELGVCGCAQLAGGMAIRAACLWHSEPKP